MGLVARSIGGLGLIDSMTEILSGHSNHSEESGRDAKVVTVAVDGSGESVWVEPSTSSDAMDQSRGVHPCLSLGEFQSGSIHNYEYSLHGSGNWSECHRRVQEAFAPRVAAAVDVACLKVCMN